MNKTFTHWTIIIFGWTAVFYPLLVRAVSLPWALDQSILPNLFPLLGLAAVSLLWLHALSGVFEPWLRQHINFDRFVGITAGLILLCILAHPLLALATFSFNLIDLYTFYGIWYILLGIIGWILLITYDITKPLRKHYNFFAMHWNKVLIISNIGFLVTFFHSLNVGSDLQTNPLRFIWIFYGITAALALFYTYVLKKVIILKN